MRTKHRNRFALATFLAMGPAAIPAFAVSGTWNGISGNWSDTTAVGGVWIGGVPADGAGFNANFTGVNIVANQTITLDTARTIGNIVFTDATTSSHNLIISGANTLTMDVAAGVPIIDVTQSGRSVTMGTPIAGNDGLQKNGAGILILNATSNNSFTNGFFVNAGVIQYDSTTNANAFGNAANVITFVGNSTIHNTNNTYTLAQGIAINPGVTGTLQGAFAERTLVDGVVSGSGTLRMQADSADYQLRLRNTANTFTGTIRLDFFGGNASTLFVNSLVDSANPIQMGTTNTNSAFVYDTGAIAPLTFNSRQIQLFSTTGSATVSNNAALANIFTINTNLGVVGVGNKTFALGGTNIGNNTFAGTINNGAGSIISLIKQDGGKWVLTNANLFTGNTTMNGGTLALGNVNALQNSTLDTGAASASKQVTFEVVGTNTYNLGGLQGTDALAIGANTIRVGANSSNTTYSGAISGTGGLTKVGAGTLTLAAANGYAGATTVLDGVLALGAAGSISGSSAIVLGPDGELDTTAQSFTMLGGQPFTWNLDPTGAGSAGLLDASILDITSGMATFSALSALDDAFYVVARYGTLNGASFASAVLPSGYVVNYNFNGLNQIALVQQTAIVPEPATASLLLLTAGGMMIRRRRTAAA